MFGSPIVDGDRTVIPVAQARFGLGVGDGLIAKGLGGGMTAKPLGFIVIDRNGVRFQRTPQPSLAPLALGVVIGLALAMRLTRPPRRVRAERARLTAAPRDPPARGMRFRAADGGNARVPATRRVD